MNRLLEILTIVAFFWLQAVTAITNDKQSFDDWKKQYKVTYKTENDEKKAFGCFRDNLKTIQSHNDNFAKRLVSFTLGLWEESDKPPNVTHSKFNRVQTSLEPRSVTKLEKFIDSKRDSLNYVTKGWVTPVQYQKKCGSCFVFAACGIVEGQYFKKTGKLVKLSEQQVLDCSRGEYQGKGCAGGIVRGALGYIKDKGVTTSAKYPYTANDSTPCIQKPLDSVTKIGNYYWPQNIDENYLKNLLTSVGPVAIAIDASQPSFMSYKSGVYKDTRCSTTKVNHAMLLVGYDTDPVWGDYWLVKNSYGTTWGIDGFMRLERNANRCGVTYYVVYATM